jgi:hypothetical protein
MPDMHPRTRSAIRNWRLALALAANASLLGLIGWTFWLQDWQYSLPTPRPEGLFQIPVGASPILPAALAAVKSHHRPMLVNFANAKCPCTEFNLDHVRKLQQQFGDSVDFVTIIESSSEERAEADFASMHLRMPMLPDVDGLLSDALGVYGTPQAAILDADGRIYFRGNYNQSRYCNEETSEYVRIALTALSTGRKLPAMPAAATITYGCPLPPRFRLSAAVPSYDERAPVP